MHWLDIQEIAEALAAAHDDIDPTIVSFPTLNALVLSLPNFAENQGHPCNERILEAIQQAWIDERD